MGTNDGYHVKHAGMKSQSEELDGAGEQAGGIGKLLSDTACYPQEVLGGSDSGPAFNAYSTAWIAEARTLEDALHELADKVRASKGAYAGSDGLVRTSAQRISVGDAVSTNPVYGTAPIGTNPVHANRPAVLGTAPIGTNPVQAERPSALTDY
ncbi:hypothetical protein ACIREE_01250 [Streptomyces sp. NPDC102467]|uniref:hypothetical protein n=1 Tax=Streptomyces sp. NPDC102467 TaxID=3366179 RepID=UPI0037FE4288